METGFVPKSLYQSPVEMSLRVTVAVDEGPVSGVWRNMVCHEVDRSGECPDSRGEGKGRKWQHVRSLRRTVVWKLRQMTSGPADQQLQSS